MVNTNAVAADLVAASGVIDDLEASAIFGSTTPFRKHLAHYQTRLGSYPTSGNDDLRFLTYFKTWWNRVGWKKG